MTTQTFIKTLGGLIVIGIVTFLIVNANLHKAEPSAEKYTDDIVGYSVEYKRSPNGYVPQPIRENLPEEIVSSVAFFEETAWKEFNESTGPREAPPAITIQAFLKTSTTTPTIDWVKTSRYSNYVQGGAVETWKTDERDVVAYTFSGLYENDAIALSYGNYILMFTASWMTDSDPMRADLLNMIATLK